VAGVGIDVDVVDLPVGGDAAGGGEAEGDGRRPPAPAVLNVTLMFSALESCQDVVVAAMVPEPEPTTLPLGAGGQAMAACRSAAFMTPARFLCARS
jgi:hypothetical protein